MSNKPSHWIWLALGIMWLPSGRVFNNHTAHFDWGCLPLILWHYSLPVFSLMSVIPIVMHCRCRRGALTVAWCGHGFAYLLFASASWLGWPASLSDYLYH
jgi:hypothetical protein